ncbi:hypothetical protein AZE42_05519, partial [Rhizopogon vesiculosus]
MLRLSYTSCWICMPRVLMIQNFRRQTRFWTS